VALEAICLEKIKAAQVASNIQAIMAGGGLSACLDAIGKGGMSAESRMAMCALLCYC